MSMDWDHRTVEVELKAGGGGPAVVFANTDTNYSIVLLGVSASVAQWDGSIAFNDTAGVPVRTAGPLVISAEHPTEDFFPFGFATTRGTGLTLTYAGAGAGRAYVRVCKGVRPNDRVAMP